MKSVLSIAGSDCSGGAGIQADLKTIAAHKLYGMSVITAVTAQNTTGVFDVLSLPSAFVGKQLDCIFEDIRPQSVKIGMVSEASIIEIISGKLACYQAENVVIDPVMISTSGRALLTDEAIHVLTSNLLPLGRLITPNIAEAEVLSGIAIHQKKDMEKAAEKMYVQFNTAILIKGGHLNNCADDLLYDQSEMHWFCGEKVENSNTHGTGCTLSSAIACGLAEGLSVYRSVEQAKQYLSGAIADGLALGKGNGPLNHMYQLN